MVLVCEMASRVGKQGCISGKRRESTMAVQSRVIYLVFYMDQLPWEHQQVPEVPLQLL